jgi:hypothetical protein
VRVIIQHRFTVAKVSWHKKGDYLISLSQSNSAGAAAVLIHQVSKASTQRPMGKNHGQVPHHSPPPPLCRVIYRSTCRRQYGQSYQKSRNKNSLQPGVNNLGFEDCVGGRHSVSQNGNNLHRVACQAVSVHTPVICYDIFLTNRFFLHLV